MYLTSATLRLRCARPQVHAFSERRTLLPHVGVVSVSDDLTASVTVTVTANRRCILKMPFSRIVVHSRGSENVGILLRWIS